ncbi:MAG: DUF1552 domain-containing protein [Pirellulales bacterium]
MPFTRRQFLRTQGAILTLPWLASLPASSGAVEVDETAGQRKASDRPAKKLLIMYIPNGIVRRCFFPGEENADLPEFIGGFEADKVKQQRRLVNRPGIYPLELTQTLRPLADHAADVTLVTGLDRTYKNGQDVHAQGASCYLTSLSPSAAAEQGIRHPNGRTLDHVIADHVGQATVFPTLEISCNGFTAPKEPIEFDNISWYGPDKIAPSIRDPQKLYDRLFLRDAYRAHVADITDLVLEDARALSRQLGREDRETLDQFMTMIRDVEVRIDKLQQLLAGVDVRVPRNEVLPRGDYIRLQIDLMLLAFQMGITHICTFMIGPERWDATLMYEGVFDQPVQHHNLTHNQKGDGYKDLQKIDDFHMRQFAYLLQRMKAIPEADGSCLLDNALVTYGAGLGDGATHQYYDLPLIVAGRAQGQIKQGRLVKCPSGTLNSNLWLTCARLMGVNLPRYADSTDVISDLWT